MRRLALAILPVVLSVAHSAWELQSAWAQQPSKVEKTAPTTAPSNPPNPTDTKSKVLKVVPLTIEQSGNSAGERVNEFSGRKDVLKSSAKAGAQFSTSVEVELPKDILSKGPSQSLYLSLSVFPPAKGTANLLVRKKELADLFLFRGDINQLSSVHPAIIQRKDGWVDLRFSLRVLGPATKSIVLELNGDPNTTAETFAYWAAPELQLESNVSYEELDPTKRTIFQLYSDRGYPKAQLVDAATGNVLKHGIGIGWIGTKTTCQFAKDGSHVAVISENHDNPRSGSTDYEHLWVFSLSPFGQVQEESSRKFYNIRFAEDNKTLLFESKGKPEISGK